MSEKWGASGNIELKISFDNNLKAKKLRKLEVDINKMQDIKTLDQLPKDILKELSIKLASLIEEHNKGIKLEAIDYIRELFSKMKSFDIHFYNIDINISIDNGKLNIDYSCRGENISYLIISELMNYNFKTESMSFVVLMTEIKILLKKYGFVIDSFEVKNSYYSKKRCN